MRRQPERLTEERFDLLIIGGGINGAGSCRDAAMRGLKTALIERADFASGTSSASSKLVHGGLRYLEQGAIRLVRESLRERSVLLKIAPHLVHPLPFHLPIYKWQKHGKLAMKAGLSLYDMLAGKQKIRAHQMFSRAEMIMNRPKLKTSELRAGAQYYDAWMDDSRLSIVNVIDGARRGAVVCNYCEAKSISRDRNGDFIVEALDQVAERTVNIRARAVLNATGPWSDNVRKELWGKAENRLTLSKGVHLVFSSQQGEAALLLFARDGRVFFVIPWFGITIVGTTDTPFEGDPAQVSVTQEDTDYLLESISQYIGNRKQWEERLISSFAGIRPLVAQKKQSTYRVGREHLILNEPPGFFSVIGGKYTTYRLMAEQCVDKICQYLNLEPQCTTALTPLPGGDMDDFSNWTDRARERLSGRSEDSRMLDNLFRLLGSETEDFLGSLSEGERLDPVATGYPIPRQLIDYCRREEMAIFDEDIYRRRTPLSLMGYEGS